MGRVADSVPHRPNDDEAQTLFQWSGHKLWLNDGSRAGVCKKGARHICNICMYGPQKYKCQTMSDQIPCRSMRSHISKFVKKEVEQGRHFGRPHNGDDIYPCYHQTWKTNIISTLYHRYHPNHRGSPPEGRKRTDHIFQVCTYIQCRCRGMCPNIRVGITTHLPVCYDTSRKEYSRSFPPIYCNNLKFELSL